MSLSVERTKTPSKTFLGHTTDMLKGYHQVRDNKVIVGTPDSQNHNLSRFYRFY